MRSVDLIPFYDFSVVDCSLQDVQVEENMYLSRGFLIYLSTDNFGLDESMEIIFPHQCQL